MNTVAAHLRAGLLRVTLSHGSEVCGYGKCQSTFLVFECQLFYWSLQKSKNEVDGAVCCYQNCLLISWTKTFVDGILIFLAIINHFYTKVGIYIRSITTS